METNKTLATYIALGAVFIIVLGLLAVGLIWAGRRWRCPYPCCCVWRCFQDPVQLEEARAYLYTVPRNISWGVRRRWPSLTMQVGLNIIYVPVLYQRLLCAILVLYGLALSRFFNYNLLTVSKYQLFHGLGSISARLIGLSLLPLKQLLLLLLLLC